jgi:tungstate transport system substrate-binding protein
MCGALVACTSSAPRVRLGTTYTVEQSGALAILDSLAHPAPATVIGPSGQILVAAARGDLDVVITHAPSLEQRILVAPGHVLVQCPFVASRFAIVGPAGDPARVAAAPDAAEAFRRIAATAGGFVSRGDSSGTHVKELALWRAAGVRPVGPWYIQSGGDQATTLHIADERGAYALADLPTLAKLGDLRLRVLFGADTALVNPYTLYVIRLPRPNPAAEAFARWAMDSARAHILALHLPGGAAAFSARAGACVAPAATGASRPAPRTEAGAAAETTPLPGRGTGSALAGRWEYVALPRGAPAQAPALATGLQVTLAFDSSAGDSAFGKVTRWFAGDVGVSPGNFGLVRARASGAEVELVIPFRRGGAPAITVQGTLVGADTLAINDVHQGDAPGPFARGPGAAFARIAATASH